MKDAYNLTRRNLLHQGALWTGAIMSLPLMNAGRRLAHAQASAPPMVDRLAVRVVIDSYQDSLARSHQMGTVHVERAGTYRSAAGSRSLRSQWGFGLHLESQRNAETRHILLDFGATSDVLFHNYDLLNIDVSSVDALVVSHGHDDHFGGLVPLLQRSRATMPKDLQVYIGGEDTLCYRWIRPGLDTSVSYVLDRRAIEAANVKIVLAPQSTVVAGHAFTTGEIPRVSFETILPTPHIELGMRDSMGCHGALFSKEGQDGQIMVDEFPGEHATCYHVKGRGLVVISSCGHKGIINSIRQAQTVSGVQKIHAVMGGFHLSPATEPYIAQTVQALKELNPDHVLPMHCSGPGFIQAMQREFPKKLILSYTGSKYTFGA